MFRNSITRSLLQLGLLCTIAAWLSTTPVKAFDFDCTAVAADCGQMCGSSVTWQYQYSECHYWNPEPPFNCLDWWHEYSYSYGSGVENFECDEASETYWCQCAY